jgi:hypothetical protein
MQTENKLAITLLGLDVVAVVAVLVLLWTLTARLTTLEANPPCRCQAISAPTEASVDIPTPRFPRGVVR